MSETSDSGRRRGRGIGGALARARTRRREEPSTKDAPALLRLVGVDVTYVGDAIRALKGIDLEVPRGSIVTLLGPNGAGKTTTLRAITGLLRLNGGRLRSGTIEFDGQRIEALPPAGRVGRGMSQVMEGRRVFSDLTVDENLQAGAFTVRDKRRRDESYERVMTLFPALAERRKQRAGYLSGGEQQMLAIGRALMPSPDLLLLDEPSLGLAPLLVQRIRDTIREINEAGTSVLLIEQNTAMALSISHYAYILDQGNVAKRGTPEELQRDASLQAVYLGGSVDEKLPPSLAEGT